MMHHQRPRPRLHRLIAVEACEPRQMLSAASVTADPAAFVGQALETRLSSTTLTLGHVAWSASTWSPGAPGSQNLTLNYLTLNNVADAVAGGMTNAYGNSSNVRPAIDKSTPSDLLATPSGHTSDMPWRTAPVAGLDPFAPPPTNTPSPRVDAPNGGTPIVQLSSGLAAEAGATRWSSAPWFSGNDGANTFTRPMQDTAAPRWLSASFTPAEQQRLEALQGASSSEKRPSPRDPQAKSALEPTRLITQTFCLVPRDSASNSSPGRQPTAPWQSAPAARALAPQAPKSLPPVNAHAQSATTPAAGALAEAHDAAILALLGSPTTHQPVEGTSVAFSASPFATPTSRAPSDPPTAESESHAWRMAVPFFDDWHHASAALLAGTALQLLWSRGSTLDEASISTPQLKPAKRARS